MFFRISSLAATIAFFGIANATCALKNRLTAPGQTPETKTQLCTPQGEGSWTFAMDVSDIDVPTFNGGNANAGNVGGYSFTIYDNYCIPYGTYGPDGNNCGTPFQIQDYFLPWTLIVDTIDAEVGGAYFSFHYAAGKYSIKNNHCVCANVPRKDPGAETGCKCAFPIKG